MLSELVQWAYSQGYELTEGEAFRTAEQAAWDAAHGTGIRGSLHTLRLAMDYNLFINGVYQSNTAAYRPMGEHWEAMGGSWGGRFAKPDGNHFSLAYGGVREVQS